MLAIERRSEIMSLLEQNQSVLVSELSKQYNVTEETIRRDLEKLEKDGFAEKTYGGAVLRQTVNLDMPFRVRERTNKEGKFAIAQKAAALIEDGDTIMLDSSSTALAIARQLKHRRHITIITNSIEVLIELSAAPDLTVISTGGTLRGHSLSLVGRNAERMLRNFNVDKAFISCKGIDPDKGITESNEMEVEIKRAMRSAAKTTYIAVDHTKFDKVSFVKLADLADIGGIITDFTPDEAWQETFRTNNIDFL